jgi:ATP-dependent helicase/nuclease subunit A
MVKNVTATRESAREFPNEIIRASAGTGKTFELSNRYLKLLAHGVECQTILATTFTRKGAGEILDRIVSRLSDAALSESGAEKLSRELDWQLSQTRAAAVLHNLLRNLHRLEIGTLDSFFNRVAKAFSLELGLPPSWEIVEELQMNRLYDQSIQAVLQRQSVIHLLHMLAKGQADRRVASLIRDTVDQAYSIFQESGPEPWDQLERTGHFLPDHQLELLVAHILDLKPDKKSLKKHWESVKQMAAAGDWSEFASTRSFQNFLDGNLKFGQTKLTPDIIEIYQKLVNHCTAFIQQRLINQNHSTRDLLQEFGTILEQAKTETGFLRFDDVTMRLPEVVSNWDTDRFGFRLDRQIQHLLLDEFQDTSLGQWNVIRPFAQRVTTASDSLRSFFCVGDMKQAIFGWRGGVAEIFDLVDQELPNLAARKLIKSYRSAPPVIDLVNETFLNVDRYDCDDVVVNEAIRKWATWFEPHSTEHRDWPGYVTLEMAKDCSASQKSNEWSKDTIRNENVMKMTVERVKELSETLPVDRTIGVIVRTNSEVADLIFRLQREGIRASEEGGNALTDSAAVELVLSAIKLADFPGDSIARFHLSHSPLGNTFGLIPENETNQKQNGQAAVVAAASLRESLVNDGYGPTVERLSRSLTPSCTRRELLRLQQLVQVAYDSPNHHDAWQLRPGQFVAYVRDEVKISDESSANVRVMTIHKAKGLEFDVVVFPVPLTSRGWAGLTPSVVVGRPTPASPIEIATRYANRDTRRLLPPKFQQVFEEDRQRNVRESMCVLYVALTRAAHATHVIVSHGAKVDHQSAAGILMATLCPDGDRREGLLYERGDPTWFLSAIGRQTDSTELDLSKFYLAEAEKLNPGTISKEIRSGRGLPRTAPSLLEGGERLVLRSVLRSEKNKLALARGRLLHGCFELVEWLDRGLPDDSVLLEHLRKLDPAADGDDLLRSFHKLLQHDNVQRLLSRESYEEMYLISFSDSQSDSCGGPRLEVFNERPFAVQLDSGWLEGIIDRLIIVYDGDRPIAADIIDFKTDEAASGKRLREQVDRYQPQLKAYQAAASQFLKLPLERIGTRLLFVESGHLENLHLVESSFSPDTPMGLPIPKRKKFKKPQSANGATPKRPVRKKSDVNQKTLWPED